MKTVICALFLLLPACSSTGGQRGAALQADPACTAFVDEYLVRRSEPDLQTVRSLVRAITDRRLFTRVERRMMANWHRRPETRDAWVEALARRTKRMEELEEIAGSRLLDGTEAKTLSQLQRTVYQMKRRDAAWREVYAEVSPADYPFVLRGEQAVRLRVIDGCTSASRVFCVLAQATGMDARPIDASNFDSMKEIWRPGEVRQHATVNGHKMALVEIQGRWHLVNTNLYVPNRAPSYEIWTELNDIPVGPNTLLGTMLRLPSAQVADGRRSPRLLVTAVGDRGSTTLGEYSLAANLNLAASGNPASGICNNPAFDGLIEPK